jgi:hypothetical protein
VELALVVKRKACRVPLRPIDGAGAYHSVPFFLPFQIRSPTNASKTSISGSFRRPSYESMLSSL